MTCAAWAGWRTCGATSPILYAACAGLPPSPPGIPLLNGRIFEDSDKEGSPGVAIVSSSLARRLLPGQNPIGRRISDAFSRGTWLTIVGVVGDVHNSGPAGDIMPQLYRPFQQLPLSRMFILVRSPVDAKSLAGGLRNKLQAIDPDQPLFDLMTLEQRLSKSLMTPRVNLGLFGSFAVISVLLACIGIYGVVACSIGRRRNELAVRMALGARLGNILQATVSKTLGVCLLGVAVGAAGSWALMRLFTSFLYKTDSLDPVVLIPISLAFLCIVAIATYIPARKAARVDPIIALKCE